MGVPVDLLVDHKVNVYELTVAMIRRAKQISLTGEEMLEEDETKTVSSAIAQILTKKVEYWAER